MTELRHKYITIVKSLYWDFFAEGMCSPETIVVLSSSCDHAFDDEKFPMNDWEHCDGYNFKGFEKRVINYLSSLPCIGKIAKAEMFDSLAFSYDMAVNFVEAHEQASKMI